MRAVLLLVDTRFQVGILRVRQERSAASSLGPDGIHSCTVGKQVIWFRSDSCLLYAVWRPYCLAHEFRTTYGGPRFTRRNGQFKLISIMAK